MNIAYEQRYHDWRRMYDQLFAPENRCPVQDEDLTLSDGFSVRSESYTHNGNLNLSVSENKLLDSKGRALYVWRNLDDSGNFCSLFRHNNGCNYLIFHIELYGYSVIELESKQEMHYVPSQVHPKEGQEADEVFIWTSAYYESDADLLIVNGCIWACPYSTIVLDFSEPLLPQPAEQWLDMRALIDPDFSLYGDIEFACREGEELVFRGRDRDDGTYKEIRVSTERIRADLQKKKPMTGQTENR